MTVAQRMAIATLLLTTTGSVFAQEWYQEDPTSSPAGRRFAGAAFDPARGVTIVFGGTDERAATVFGDTWEYDGAEWAQRTTSGPAARERFASCFHRGHGVFVVFGGRDANGMLLGDMWAFDGKSWSQVQPANLPPARMDATLAYDEVRDRIVLFGGRPLDPAKPFADTWEFDGVDWLQRSPATSPDPRFGHVSTFDAQRGVTVLFGGFTNGGSATDADTWEYDGKDWREVVTATVPAKSVFPALTFHRRHQVAVLVGATGSFNPAPQTWAFDGIDWQRGPLAPNGFAGRQGHSLAYDEARDAVVLFGGATITLGGATARQGTWEMSERAAFASFGHGCNTSAGLLALSPRGGALPEIGRTLVLEAAPVSRPSLPLLLVGGSDAQWAGQALPLDLSPFGLPGCGLFVSIDVVLPMSVAGGSASTALSIPRKPELLGLPVFAQALILAPDGATSNAARLALGN